jgi:hypothetical protein
MQSEFLQFVGETSFICRLQQARAEFAVNLNCGSDDFRSEISGMHDFASSEAAFNRNVRKDNAKAAKKDVTNEHNVSPFSRSLSHDLLS